MLNVYRTEHSQYGYKLLAAQSRTTSDRWSRVLGPDKVIPLPGLYTFTEDEWEDLTNANSRHSSAAPSIIETGSTTSGSLQVPKSHVSSPTLSNRSSLSRSSTPRAKTPVDRVSVVESEPHMAVLTTTETTSAPPWRQIRAVTTPVTSKSPSPSILSEQSLPAAVTRRPGGSLLDQYYANQKVSKSLHSSVLQSNHQSEDSFSIISDHTARDSHPDRKERLVVPVITAIEGSIAGSPPESDEDEPSVQVPHSARRFVQRPVIITEADDEEDGYSAVASTPRTVSTPLPSDAARSHLRRDTPPHMIPQARSPQVHLRGRPVARAAGLALKSLQGGSRAGSSRAPGTSTNNIPLGSRSVSTKKW